MAGQYPPDLIELRALGCKTLTLPAAPVLWRIHLMASAPIVPWNRLRTWGPVAGSRWEPHPLPPGGRFVDVDRDAPYITRPARSGTWCWPLWPDPGC